MDLLLDLSIQNGPPKNCDDEKPFGARIYYCCFFGVVTYPLFSTGTFGESSYGCFLPLFQGLWPHLMGLALLPGPQNTPISAAMSFVHEKCLAEVDAFVSFEAKLSSAPRFLVLFRDASSR